MAYKYKAICHTQCYWLETLWEVGEVYEGDIKPNKHFSEDGQKDPKLPPPEPGTDPRSTEDLKKALKAHPHNFRVPGNWSRKQIWVKLRDLEIAAERDALVKAEKEFHKKFMSLCGEEWKSKAGMVSHERKCAECKAILDAKKKAKEATMEVVNDDSNPSEHLQSGPAPAG